MANIISSSAFGAQETKTFWCPLTELLAAERQVLFWKEIELHNFITTAERNWRQNRSTYNKVKWSEGCSVVSDSLQPHALNSPWHSPDQNTGVSSLSLLQGIFLTQGSNLGLLYCRRILYQLRHKESLRILEWAAYPFSSGSSQPRNQTGVSCIAGGFFTNWAMREARTSLKWGENH